MAVNIFCPQWRPALRAEYILKEKKRTKEKKRKEKKRKEKKRKEKKRKERVGYH
jgi:hypothetical protein